ncbi:hypothetical protein BO94DRAFT_224077 [Aspergillus sclerotioniger CBS 115572]|uniref:Uncharacterized protein n=1 Tax=Aspergillus sclerotioniger CBS 115572 TaxID=1450535 RepID=A0A317XF30_9EURO|nr:hypothetical protein BO94DRAFT_224077 [Aspergillus sclerotioniger CBS 115572]PWY95290.1 hypothetical protein BO94DRAFT_224077 [Aspergillus sclerotioniger CBS 115572]
MPKLPRMPKIQKYPLSITELTKDELDSIISVLVMGDMDDETDDNKADDSKTEKVNAPVTHDLGEGCDAVSTGSVRTTIRNLPWKLRRSMIMQWVPQSKLFPAVLCDAHEDLNPCIINDAFYLLKREVTRRLAILKWYVEYLTEDIKALTRALNAINGMWGTPHSKAEHPKELDKFQQNKCEACMIARIVTAPLSLQNLRAAMLSRGQTRRSHRPPRLLALIEAGIEHYATASELYCCSTAMALSAKTARKAAYNFAKAQRRKLPRRESTGRQIPRSIVIYWNASTPHQTVGEQKELLEDLGCPKGERPKSYDTIADSIIAKYCYTPDEADPVSSVESIPLTRPLAVNCGEGRLLSLTSSDSGEHWDFESQDPTLQDDSMWQEMILTAPAEEYQPLMNSVSDLLLLSESGVSDGPVERDEDQESDKDGDCENGHHHDGYQGDSDEDGDEDSNEDGDHEDGDHEDGDHEDGDHEDGDHEDGDHEDGDHEDGDHEDGDHEDGDHEDGDHEDGDHEDGDHEDGDHEDGDHEDGDHKNRDHESGGEDSDEDGYYQAEDHGDGDEGSDEDSSKDGDEDGDHQAEDHEDGNDDRDHEGSDEGSDEDTSEYSDEDDNHQDGDHGSEKDNAQSSRRSWAAFLGL